MAKILVTGAGSTLGQGIIKSIKKASTKHYIVAGDPSPLSVGLFWANESVKLVNANRDDFIQEFSKVIGKIKPDIVCIGTDVELPKVAQFKSELESIGQCKIIISSPEVIEIANDKFLTAQYLERMGFAHPTSVLPESWENSRTLFHFPLIVKPRDGARSIGVQQVLNEVDLKKALLETKNPVIQEYLSEEQGEYTAGVVCFDGEVLGSIVMRRDLKDGNTYRAYSDSFPELNDQVRAVARTLNPHGPCNFQFRLGSKGEIKIFEINARFSGTTPIRATVGFNEVEFIINHLLGLPQTSTLHTEKRVVLRYWEELVLNPNDLKG